MTAMSAIKCDKNFYLNSCFRCSLWLLFFLTIPAVGDSQKDPHPPAEASPQPAPPSPASTPAAAPTPAVQPAKKPPFTAIPRYVNPPEVKGTVVCLPPSVSSAVPQTVRQEGQRVTLAEAGATYQVVFLLGSWNPRSAAIIEPHLQKISKLRQRGVQVWGVFLQDNPTAMKAWCAKVRPTFPLLLADVEVTKSFDGKPIPAFFVTDSNYHFIINKEEPSDSEISAAFEKIIKWTDF